MTQPATPAPASTETTCRNCGATASGRFCASCGASLAGATCAACDAPLTPGARFCHRCGTPAGESAPLGRRNANRGFEGALPWFVAAVALVALIALVAGQRFSSKRTDDANAAIAGGTAVDAAPNGTGFPRARTDIASMSPEEAASRLFNRVMTYAERNQSDSAQLFAPMAIAAYQRIQQPNADQRYDLGRIAAVAGNEEIAGAEADTILASNPDHLLGLILAAETARMKNDEKTARQILQHFVKAAPAQKALNLPEYQEHANDIAATLDEAANGRR